MPDYLLRLAQAHESFRQAELHALAEIAGVTIEILEYSEDVGFIIYSFLSRFTTSLAQIFCSQALG